MRHRASYLALSAVCLMVVPLKATAGQSVSAAIRIDNDDIGGVVTSENGPEAGVWVIAQTRALPTIVAQDCCYRWGRTLRSTGSSRSGV